MTTRAKILLSILGLILTCIICRELYLCKTVNDVKEKFTIEYKQEINNLSYGRDKLINLCLYNSYNLNVSEKCIDNVNKVYNQSVNEIEEKYNVILGKTYVELRQFVIDNKITTSRN